MISLYSPGADSADQMGPRGRHFAQKRAKSRVYSAAAGSDGFAAADDSMKSEMRGTISDLKRDPLNTP